MLVLLGVRGFVINRPIGHLIEHQHRKAIPVQLIHIQILNAHEGFLLIQRQNFCVIVFVEDIFDDCAALRPHELSHNVVRCRHSFLELLVFIHMPLQQLFDFSDVVGDHVGLAVLPKEISNRPTHSLRHKGNHGSGRKNSAEDSGYILHHFHRLVTRFLASVAASGAFAKLFVKLVDSSLNQHTNLDVGNDNEATKIIIDKFNELGCTSFWMNADELAKIYERLTL